MIRINLLPVRQRRKLEAARRELFIALFGGVLVLFACLAGWGGLQVRHAALRAEVVALQKEVERLGVEVTQVDALEKFRDDLQRKLSVIDGLRRRKTGPVHMLDDLAIATPERLFLESVSERDGAIQIVGFAVSNELISQFLRQLDASPYFDAVFLQNIEAVNAKSDASVALRKFDITARTSSPAEEAANVPPLRGQRPRESFLAIAFGDCVRESEATQSRLLHRRNLRARTSTGHHAPPPPRARACAAPPTCTLG
jgi:type IV pilus assembly protein PilN